MIMDLHLSVPSLKYKFRWFNDIENHYIFEFSDDGAPESRDGNMCIGSFSLWNLGNRIRSREYQYPLHTVSCGEKEKVMEDLWKQHTDEMLLMEGNILNANGEQVTVEFQPSADQAWQFWGNNVLPQNATYPSMFANVHKGELSLIGGTMGEGTDYKWQVPTMDTRLKEIGKLQKFCEELPLDISENSIHRKKLDFMTSNGLRQMGIPRINI